MSIMMMLVMGISMASCGGDDKNDDDSYLEENGGGSGSNNAYSYDDFVGHWVNEEQWDYCMYVISFIESRPCYYITTYTDNYDLQNGVGGFYIAYGKKAYYLWITVSDRKYDNNPVAGNRPIKTWCVNGEYAYFLNVESTTTNVTFYMMKKTPTSCISIKRPLRFKVPQRWWVMTELFMLRRACKDILS